MSTVLTVSIVVAAVFALGALEVWLFWKIGDYVDRRRERSTQVRKASRGASHAHASARRLRQDRRLHTAA